jgi:hypothetical protein
MTSRRDIRDDAPWPADWESSRREQMLRFRALPLAEKVKAVEEMERLARALASAVRRRPR